MAERNRSAQAWSRRRSGQVPVWLVVLIVILLVAVGIYLIYQANQRATTVEAQSQEQIGGLERQVQGAEARIRLSAFRNELQQDGDPEELEQRYQDIRSDLEAAYGDAEGEAGEAWDEVQEDMDVLGDQIAESSEEAVATLDSILSRLTASVEGNP